MGRRSVNTTKSGKFMNPTDQARKEARKKELKKNKKQRLLVRTAVLKNKDPGQIFQELDKLDEVEFNPTQPPPLAEKVLKDKRKKLKETLDRVMKLYQKEDSTYFHHLRQAEAEYERRRFQRIQFFEAVKQAEQISVEDIPLPTLPGPSGGSSIEDIPLPTEPTPFSDETLHSILKNSYNGKEPPGVPPGSPPDLSDIDDSDIESEEKSSSSTEKTIAGEKTVRFADDPDSKTLSEMDKFMKEMEAELSKTNEDELKPPGTELMGLSSSTPVADKAQAKKSSSSMNESKSEFNLPPPPPPSLTNSIRPPMHQFFPPPPPPRLRFSVPPPPGPGGPLLRAPPIPPGPQFLQRGVPGNFNRFRPPRNQIFPSSQSSAPSNKSEAKPPLSGTMIEAKPQIRSLSADVTRFIPVAVKVKKDDDKPKHEYHIGQPTNFYNRRPDAKGGFSSKDDAYEEFMKEMSGLL